jgi:hypothetical protein
MIDHQKYFNLKQNFDLNFTDKEIIMQETKKNNKLTRNISDQSENQINDLRVDS